MRDSALKPRNDSAGYKARRPVGEELMRDSALKPACQAARDPGDQVGEELMRDSALKLMRFRDRPDTRDTRRRRAHARQRFETRYRDKHLPHAAKRVGEELMRDSALKPARSRQGPPSPTWSEKSSCATAL